MSVFSKVQAEVRALPLEQQEELYRNLGALLYPSSSLAPKARVVREGEDVLLEASSEAPPMTAENVRKMLEDCP